MSSKRAWRVRLSTRTLTTPLKRLWLAKAENAADNSYMTTADTIQFQATPELRQELEEAAAKLHLSMSAYILYLHKRVSPNQDASRLDRHVGEVFGRHGELMRRLAK